MADTWTEGYRAGMNGATHEDNPHPGDAGTAWAFGLSEGRKERQSQVLAAILGNYRAWVAS